MSAASCGIIQVFLIVFYAQCFQNTFILARNLLNSTHPIQCFMSHALIILNGELWLKLEWFHLKLQKLLFLSLSLQWPFWFTYSYVLFLKITEKFFQTWNENGW